MAKKPLEKRTETLPMRILAHRGFTKEHTANSIESIRAALRRGFSCEVDVRMTADNKLILNHDAVINTPNGTEVHLQKESLSVIRQMISSSRAEKENKIPLLEEVLDVFIEERASNATLALHLKDARPKNIEQHLSRCLRRLEQRTDELDVFEHIFVFDIRRPTARYFDDIEPRLSLGCSVGDSILFPDDRYPTVYDFETVRKDRCWDIIWADEWRAALYDESFLTECLSEGFEVYCVSPELHSETVPVHPQHEQFHDVWENLGKYNIDGICTDHPAALKRFET